MRNKTRFIAGLILVIASAALTLATKGHHNPMPYTALGIVGIVFIATARKRGKENK